MTATAATSAGVGLERSYRRLLRALPPAYRRDREREMVDVMLELSPPDRRRPRVADGFDVAVIAARQWFRLLFFPRRGEGRTAASTLAVLLPMVLIYPVNVVTYRFVVTSTVEGALSPRLLLQISGVGVLADWLSWLFWAGAIACLLIGKSGLARFPAAAGTLAFGFFFLGKFAEGYQRVVVMNVGWLVIQVVALALLFTPDLVNRGLPIVRRRTLLVIAVAIGGLGLTTAGFPSPWGMSIAQLPDVARPELIVAAAAAVGGAVCLASATGRAVLPFLTALLVPLVAPRILLSDTVNFGNAPTLQHVPWKEASLAAVALIAVYAGCRLATSVTSRLRATRAPLVVTPRAPSDQSSSAQ